VNVTRNVAIFNLASQAVLIGAVFVGVYLGRTRRFRQHCLLMRVLMGVQILLIGIIMGPQLVRFFPNLRGFSLFDAELLIHHVLGLVLWPVGLYQPRVHRSREGPSSLHVVHAHGRCLVDGFTWVGSLSLLAHLGAELTRWGSHAACPGMSWHSRPR